MEIWDCYAAEFPIRERLIYMNHAGIAPLCRRAANAMRELTDDALEWGSWHYHRWLATYDELRKSTARLIGSKPNEIAIVKNTSEGIATVANGLKWAEGDRIVAFQEEFPANVFPWLRLERQYGVEVTWLSYLDPLDRIEEACRGARLLSISYVQYLSGHRADLKVLGEICARQGCLFLVDAIQGLGVFPLDVRTCKISALAADGHKWLLGPEGCGILYVREEWQDQIEPTEFGWTNTAQFNDYASLDTTLRPDAGRYECGTLNTVGCHGLRASIDFLLEIGIDRVEHAVRQRANQIAAGLLLEGCHLLGDRNEENDSGIISFRRSDEPYMTTLRRMKEAKIIAAPRQGWVRVSPHFYTTPRDAEALLEAVAR